MTSPAQASSYAYRADPAPEHDRRDRRRPELMSRDPCCHHCRAGLAWRRLRHGDDAPANFAMLARAVRTDGTLGPLVLLCQSCWLDPGLTGPPAGREWRGGRQRWMRILRGRDGDNCALCGKLIDFRLPMNGSRPSPGGPTMGASIDHKIPRAAGGTNRLDNLQLAHGRCNQRKGAKMDGADCDRHMGAARDELLATLAVKGQR